MADDTDQDKTDSDGVDLARIRLWKHIRSIATCVMVTMDGAYMRGRPMRGMAREEENAIWFYSDLETHKDEEVRRDPRACLAYSDVKDQSFVSVSGRITPVHDREKIKAMWSEGASVYFPGGPDDPNVILLKFEPEFGEYWDAPSSKIVLAIKFLQAKISGERPDLGSNETATLS